MPYAGFLLLAIVVGGSALGVILVRNPIHAALLLTVNLAGVAALYLMLQAQFLALVQVIVYAGAIAVLFVFAIMVLIPGKEETGPDPLRGYRWLAVPLAGLLLLETLLVLRSSVLQSASVTAAPNPSGEPLYRLLLTDFLFPFEVTSVLLLTALVGVMALTKRKVS
ncbi:MAG TPA: NADH-quinone oxidoreductase subunit J [Verrucomicrobiae bacterium]|jgi:NADH-quinone oxidoreductase subunit J|nr:NADH-quinone oxidoreductase subunit J [Verrucomicrobiae bacterium]